MKNTTLSPFDRKTPKQDFHFKKSGSVTLKVRWHPNVMQKN